MRTYETLGRAALVAAALTVLGACRDAPEEDAAPPPPDVTGSAAAATLADIQAAGIQNAAMPLGNVLTAAQPTQEQLSALIGLGYTNFVSLRTSTEEGAGWEEGIAADEGIHFTRIPVPGTDGLTRENVLELDRILTEAGEEGTVVYCSSGNRVGALLALRAYWLEGADTQAALELGRRAGLSRHEPNVAELLAASR